MEYYSAVKKMKSEIYAQLSHFAVQQKLTTL